MVALLILLSPGLVVEALCAGAVENMVSIPLHSVMTEPPRAEVSWSYLLNAAFTIMFLLFYYTSRIGSLFAQAEQGGKGYIGQHTLGRTVSLIMKPKCKIRIATVDTDVRKARQADITNSKLSCFSNSFASSFPVMLFVLAYGMAKVWSIRWRDAPDISNEVDAMSFGQIVPLLLLLIPILAVIEIYYGEELQTRTS